MSGVLNSLLSSIDPSTAPKGPTPGVRQTTTATTPQPLPRLTGNTNGTSQTQPLKRKADGQAEDVQAKIQRKEGAHVNRANADIRPTALADAARPKHSTPPSTIPYRGTASIGGVGTANSTSSTVKKPNSTMGTSTTLSKPAAPAPKPAGTASNPAATPSAVKKGSYAAMLQRAKEAQSTKPAAPPIKHEPTKILTKKEREALRAGNSATTKGKKSIASNSAAPLSQAKIGDTKEKRKPTELGYTGTARPSKKPAELGYKGTARPSSTTPQPSGKLGASASTKTKSKPQARYSGYASWSDLDAEDEEEDEEHYESEGSSDMEGGMWDVETEEAMALKAAKAEDAKALAEENEHKRQKEERKRKLMALNKAAAGKRKY